MQESPLSLNLRLIAVYGGFSFLLHFAWEMLQVPLFAGMPELPHGQVVDLCTRATLGDVGIGLLAYSCGAAAQRNGLWMLRARAAGASAYILGGIAMTTVMEYAATGPLQRWSYAPEMPIVPVLGIGLSPFLQWLVVPSFVAWLTWRHLEVDAIASNSRHRT